MFKKYFEFSLEREDVLKALEELSFPVFTKNAEYDSDKKKYFPSKNGDSVRFDNGYKDYDASFIYTNIEPGTVRALRLATSGLHPNTSKEKLLEKEELNKRIERFEEKIQ